MKTIMRSTIRGLFPLNKKQREWLESCGYTDDDLKDHKSFHDALYECPECHSNKTAYEDLKEHYDALSSWWKMVDERIAKLEEAIRKIGEGQ